jgi:uncharacterized ferredoxin-like protein
MILKASEMEQKAIEEVASLMCAAARTAPKAKGIDNLVTLVVTGKDKEKLSEEMRRLAKETSIMDYVRDAGCVDASRAVVLLGQRPVQLNLPQCGYCGYGSCAENMKNSNVCAISVGDLGTAVCSAAVVAAQHFIDNRIMFRAGKAALNLDLFKDEKVKLAYGIPLSVSGKSPFFDRKS